MKYNLCKFHEFLRLVKTIVVKENFILNIVIFVKLEIYLWCLFTGAPCTYLDEAKHCYTSMWVIRHWSKPVLIVGYLVGFSLRLHCRVFFGSLCICVCFCTGELMCTQ